MDHTESPGSISQGSISPGSIIVGIDGSEAAINAARWAVPEACALDVPLRLVYAVTPPPPDAPPGETDLDTEYGETALRAACAAAHATGQPVKIETDLVIGSPARVLIDESRSAAMVCVGSVGIGRLARRVLGSTAEEVARGARCPAAVIRTNRGAATPDAGSIAVVVDESPDNDLVLQHGFREAALRAAPILALGVWRWGFGEIPYSQLEHRLGRWVQQHPDVHVHPAAARDGVAEFLSETQEPVHLAVIGAADASKVARMVGPLDPHFGHAGRSVLVVR
ncbi:universal stress protein [Mycobacterium paragordonae]|uniref:Universal stress protein n=1 Tax=Mycobacterium paragordonae TaxID=1389713 RepID=A0AAJ1S1Q2_9MYCO|nr:universal stress protein [Mycobacterium paragordonae]MDP7735062.1 universal stress protein [Mycobacterium paragordonae]GFG79181.1 universal stress protein [Mycobacterium paragordonae]